MDITEISLSILVTTYRPIQGAAKATVRDSKHRHNNSDNLHPKIAICSLSTVTFIDIWQWQRRSVVKRTNTGRVMLGAFESCSKVGGRCVDFEREWLLGREATTPYLSSQLERVTEQIRFLATRERLSTQPPVISYSPRFRIHPSVIESDGSINIAFDRIIRNCFNTTRLSNPPPSSLSYEILGFEATVRPVIDDWISKNVNRSRKPMTKLYPLEISFQIASYGIIHSNPDYSWFRFVEPYIFTSSSSKQVSANLL